MLSKIKDLRFIKKDNPDVVLNIANEISDSRGVNNLVLLPDCFLKDKFLNLEYKTQIPSSSVVTSDNDHFYPQFINRGINCGMMAISIPIKEEEITDEFVKDIVKQFSYNPIYYLLFRIRFPFKLSKYDLSKKDLLSVVENGCPATADDFNSFCRKVDMSTLRKYSRNNWFRKNTARVRNSFGRYYGGSHFFEIHKVEKRIGNEYVKQDHLVVLIHTAGESLLDIMKEDFVRDSIKRDVYNHVGGDDEITKAFFVCQQALINYSSAYRFNAFVMIRDLVKKHYNRNGSKVIMDNGHNIVDKTDQGFVYRSNSIRLHEGDLGIVAGDRVHPSYFVKGAENISELSNTIDHGLGYVMSNSKNQDVGVADKVHSVSLKRGINMFPFVKKREYSLKDNLSVDEYFKYMSDGKYCYIDSKLIPLINIKFR